MIITAAVVSYNPKTDDNEYRNIGGEFDNIKSLEKYIKTAIPPSHYWQILVTEWDENEIIESYYYDEITEGE